jgi:hypothetical protein
MRKGKNEKQFKIKNDNYTTHESAFNLLFSYINVKDKKVWFPFYNEGIINSYKFDCDIIHNQSDFFETKVEYDYIIDNPPYSIKQKVFERCIELGKPFALLVPIDTLERQYISKLFKDKDFTIIIPKERFNFLNNNVKTTMAFKTCWFCVGFNLDKQIIFSKN